MERCHGLQLPLLQSLGSTLHSSTGSLLLAAGLLGIARLLYSRLLGRSAPHPPPGMDQGPEAVQFSVATFNLRGVMDRWQERRALLPDLLRKINADVICFQEVLTGEGDGRHVFHIVGDPAGSCARAPGGESDLSREARARQAGLGADQRRRPANPPLGAGEFEQDRKLLDDSYTVFPCKAALFNLLSYGGMARWGALLLGACLNLDSNCTLQEHLTWPLFLPFGCSRRQLYPPCRCLVSPA